MGKIAPTWFEVDREGLAKLIQRKSRGFILHELVQNAWDTRAKRVDVRLEDLGSDMWRLTVEDDDPEGFRNLAHAFTMFAESEKKGDAEKRGRFNLGEKLVLAACETADVLSTTGCVVFRIDGRREQTSKRLERGSAFIGTMRMTRGEAADLAAAAASLIPPASVATYFNGTAVPARRAVRSFEAVLPTEVAGLDGVLKRTSRRTSVDVFEPLPGEAPSLYEMGIPVVELSGGERWHVNVCLVPETKVLTEDLRYVRSDTISVGDKLLGFDEHRVDGRRRFRSSTVESVDLITRPCFRLEFSDGTVVTCSEDHQWLTTKGKTRNWTKTSQLMIPVGRRPGSKVIRLLDTWGEDTSLEAGYLSAAWDGEGCLIQKRADGSKWTKKLKRGYVNRTTFVQTRNEMLQKVEESLRMKGFSFFSRWRKTKHKDICHIESTNRADMLRFLGQIRPARLLPKLSVELLGAIPTDRHVHLIKKTSVGKKTVVAIQTSTRTFIAEGLASHNCQKVPLNVDRDNVTPAYMQAVRVHLANAMVEELGKGDADRVWMAAATEDDRVAPEAVEKMLDCRFGEKRAIFDMVDREANKELMNQGYTVITGGSLSGRQWDVVKKMKLAEPSGRIRPSAVQFAAEGREEKEVPVGDYTEAMGAVVLFTEEVSVKLIGRRVRVRIINEPVKVPHAAYYGGGTLTFNMGKLGRDWFSTQIRPEHVELILHELAHERISDHLTRQFADEVGRLGVKLAWLALGSPEFFRGHKVSAGRNA